MAHFLNNLLGIYFLILCGGGVDSTYSSMKHLDKKQLLFVLKGHYDASSEGQWAHVERTLERFKNTFHHEQATAYSTSPYIINCDYPWRAKTLGNLRMIGKALPLLVHHKISQLLIPSTVTWGYPFQYHSPHVDEAVRFGKGITVLQDGTDSSRCKKIDEIKDFVEQSGMTTWPLKVCLTSRSEENCNSCRKCLLTINDFYVCGADPNKYGFKTSASFIKKEMVEYLQELNKAINYFTITHQLHVSHLNETLRYIELKDLTHKNAYAKWFYELVSNQPFIEYIRSLPPYFVPQNIQ